MFRSKEEYVFILIVLTIAALSVLFILFMTLYYYQRLRSKKNEEILKAVLSTEERERNRIAADLHDEIGPFVSALKMEVENSMDIVKDDAAISQLKKVAGKLSALAQNVRVISRSMSSATVERFGLIQSINDFKQLIEKKDRLEFHFYHDTLPALSLYAQSSLFRIIQELLANSIRHSNCTQIVLTLNCTPDNIFIMDYTDNGHTALNAGKVAGNGTLNIASRVNLLQGKFTCTEDFHTGAHYNFEFKLSQLK
jgi:signal transduction histidine kinase